MKIKYIAQHILPKQGCTKAWFYESKKHIQIYVHQPKKEIRVCWIHRSMLEDYVKRTAVKKKS